MDEMRHQVNRSKLKSARADAAAQLRLLKSAYAELQRKQSALEPHECGWNNCREPEYHRLEQQIVENRSDYSRIRARVRRLDAFYALVFKNSTNGPYWRAVDLRLLLDEFAICPLEELARAATQE